MSKVHSEIRLLETTAYDKPEQARVSDSLELTKMSFEAKREPNTGLRLSNIKDNYLNQINVKTWAQVYQSTVANKVQTIKITSDQT